MKEDENVPYPFLKWFTDKFISLTLLLITAPLFIFILIAMCVNMLFCPKDRGSIFYKERRISRGIEFNILKFRVLKTEALNLMLKENKHARVYEADINNLTWSGKYILKKCYFDELPQLLNILKGDMSLVGPRPWPVYMVKDQIKNGIEYRNHIIAGWTGPVQLQKGVDEDERPPDLVHLDLEYFNSCTTDSSFSLWKNDIKILYQTIQVMLKSEGLKN